MPLWPITFLFVFLFRIERCNNLFFYNCVVVDTRRRSVVMWCNQLNFRFYLDVFFSPRGLFRPWCSFINFIFYCLIDTHVPCALCLLTASVRVRVHMPTGTNTTVPVHYECTMDPVISFALFFFLFFFDGVCRNDFYGHTKRSARVNLTPF